jgi:hypothetical protein
MDEIHVKQGFFIQPAFKATYPVERRKIKKFELKCIGTRVREEEAKMTRQDK